MKIIKGGLFSPWKDWTPSLTWSTATPETPTVKARYKKIGKTVFFKIKIDSTDGNGTTNVAISLPIVPKANNFMLYDYAMVGVGATGNIRYMQIRDNGTNNDVTFISIGTATDGQPLTMHLSGHYEVD